MTAPEGGGGARLGTATAPGGAGPPGGALPTPSLLRRMSCFAYEATLLFGIALVPAVLGTLFFAQTGQRHPLQSEAVVRAFALALYGIYFVGCWSVRGSGGRSGNRRTTSAGSRANGPNPGKG